VLLSLIGLIVPFVLIFVAFWLVYRLAPNRTVSLAEVWPGALVAALADAGFEDAIRSKAFDEELRMLRMVRLTEFWLYVRRYGKGHRERTGRRS
jgi:glycerol-3-phosphate acyltransferase PlsY